MKNYLILLLSALLTSGCNGQMEKKDDNTVGKGKETVQPPEGSWKVNKEFDEAGNLIRYDSIYSWSSGDDLEELADLDRDSTLRSMRSRFYRNFSDFDFEEEGLEGFFADDSLFTKRFFNEDFFGSQFGRDFMDVDKMHERMRAMQKRFMDRYGPMMGPETDRDSVDNK